LRDSDIDGIPYLGNMITQARNKIDRDERTERNGADDLRSELARVLAGDAASPIIRDRIVDSWRQSAALGLIPAQFNPTCDDRIEEDRQLVRAAKPVVDRFGGDLAFSETSVVLCGGRGRVAARYVSGPLQQVRLDELMLAPGYLWSVEHAGTNGMGVAFDGSPLLVEGGEHFADVLTGLATAGAPIHDPRTGGLVGTLGLVCTVEAGNPLLLPMVIRAAREVEQRMLNGDSHLDRLLQECFLDARRRTRGPLGAVSRGTLMTNASAARLLTLGDRTRLWDLASRNLGIDFVSGATELSFILADGRGVNLALEAILDEGTVVAALIRFPTPSEARSSGGAIRSSSSGRPAYGWESLTDAKKSVTDLVAGGLTNRQVGARLFVSRHTVDSHLRHIFRKLDINSRVDLVRIVTTRSIGNRALVNAADVA
jgi:DNA-binding CsgD family transcriptional regulator